MSFSRILVISAYDIFENNDATSITIRSILKDWPKDKLYEIVCEMYEDRSNLTDKDRNKLFLSVNDINCGKIIKKLRNRKQKLIKENNINEFILIEGNSSREKTLQKIKLFLSATVDLFPYEKNKIDDFVRRYNPEVIYLIPYGIRIMDVALYINEKYEIPIITHIMDDWYSTLYSFSKTQKLHRSIMIKKYIKLLNNSKSVFVISDAMKIEYESRFQNIKFVSLMNTPDVTINYRETPSKIKQICYVGSLHLNRWSSLYKFCEIVSNLEKDDFRISVLSKDWNSVKQHFEKFNFIQSPGFLPPEQVKEEISLADSVLFIESFDESVKKYTKYSLSTKIPEYLSSQKPIIAIGPSGIASIDYLKNNNSALVLDDFNQNHWTKLLSDFFTNEKDIENLVKNAIELFKKNHDYSIIKNRVFSILNDSVGDNNPK